MITVSGYGKGYKRLLKSFQFQFQFSRSVVSNSLWPHEPQHARPPCPSPTPRVYPNSCLWSQWCHPTISSSVIPFSSCLQSFPTSRSFQTSQFFASGGQSIGVSASASVLTLLCTLLFSLNSISSELQELCVETFLVPFLSFALDACLPPSWRIRSRPSLGVTSSVH